MSYLKTAAVAAIVAAGVLGAGMTAANAGGKHHNGKHYSGKHYSGKHHHHGLHRRGFVIGTPGYGYSCNYWLRKYKRTGNPFFLNRYYACVR
jgi:hypothetical protein